MLQLVSPQKAADPNEGYVVQVADRFHVQYQCGERSATVEVDFCPVVGVYADTLTHWQISDERIEMADEEKNLVLDRIIRGLHAMGCKSEIC